VAATDPAEATRLWLALLRYVTPTLAAAAFADITPKSGKDRALEMTDEELMQVIINSPEAVKLAHEGIKTMDELVRRIAMPATVTLPARTAEPLEDELLR